MLGATPEQGSGISDAPAGAVKPATIIISRTRFDAVLAIARKAVGPRTWRKHKTWEAIIADAEQDIVDDKDGSGRMAKQRALAEIGQALEALLTS